MAKFILETERCIMRPPIPSDVDAWAVSLYGDADVLRYLPKRDMTSHQRAERMLARFNASWEERPYGGWTVVSKKDQQVIGNCAIEYIANTDEVEIGYAFSKSTWGKGIATEIVRAGVRFGFEGARLKEMVGVVVPENTASWRVLERVGFVFTGNAVYYGLDVVHYKIRSDQFKYGDFFYQARRLDEEP